MAHDFALWKIVEIGLQVAGDGCGKRVFYPVFMLVCITSDVRIPHVLRLELHEAAIYAITIKQA